MLARDQADEMVRATNDTSASPRGDDRGPVADDAALPALAPRRRAGVVLAGHVASVILLFAVVGGVFVGLIGSGVSVSTVGWILVAVVGAVGVVRVAQLVRSRARRTGDGRVPSAWDNGLDQARTIRDVLVGIGADGLYRHPPGPLILQPDEAVHLRTATTYARRQHAGLEEWCEDVPIDVTTHRIVAYLPGGVLVFDWDAVIACHGDATAVEFSFVDTVPLHLSGPHALMIYVYATARLRGIPALSTEETRALLG